ncbi:hypothetical protein RMN57_33725 [Kitasatospora sp. CM 4170]|uniref:Secreted protein n=1 Tax=Kitasatospora aburaviensis TaxID=67265 RepID=A0ABW1F112_9ACTN|nr:hypothetical protein [Kitasatospora sp. CM 4170]WNM49299.1 hypothetical protein RMN57_33725 [Kitasatospora sp. CM 4170]
MNKLMRAAAPALGALALVAAVQGTAQASAPVATTTQGAVPSCVTYVNTDYWIDYARAKVTNGCSTTQSFRLIYSFNNYDPYGCLTLAPGVTKDLFAFSFVNKPMLNGLTTC